MVGSLYIFEAVSSLLCTNELFHACFPRATVQKTQQQSTASQDRSRTNMLSPPTREQRLLGRWGCASAGMQSAESIHALATSLKNWRISGIRTCKMHLWQEQKKEQVQDSKAGHNNGKTPNLWGPTQIWTPPAKLPPPQYTHPNQILLVFVSPTPSGAVVHLLTFSYIFTKCDLFFFSLVWQVQGWSSACEHSPEERWTKTLFILLFFKPSNTKANLWRVSGEFLVLFVRPVGNIIFETRSG